MSKVRQGTKDEGMNEYDFGKGKRGAVVPARPAEAGKTKVTIRLDDDVLDHFMAEAEKSGGKVGYQTLINQALREGMTAQGTQGQRLLDAMRRVVREELAAGRQRAS